MAGVQLPKLSLLVTWDGTQVNTGAWGVQHLKRFGGSGKYYL